MGFPMLGRGLRKVLVVDTVPTGGEVVLPRMVGISLGRWCSHAWWGCPSGGGVPLQPAVGAPFWV